MKLSALGYTLVELLVVTAIIAILAVVGVVNFKDSSTEQFMTKGVGDIQTRLRQAQSNASSGTLCDGHGAIIWYVKFTDEFTMELDCNAGVSPKTYTLENTKVAIKGDEDCIIADGSASYPFPATFSYSPGASRQTISSTGASDACLSSQVITLSISSTKNPSLAPKTLKVSQGGAINVASTPTP